MTPHEVVDNLLRGKPADRVGTMEYFWYDTLSIWCKRGYPKRRVYKEAGETLCMEDDGFRRKVKAAGHYVEPVPSWEHFNLDMAYVGGYFDVEPLFGYDELIDQTDEWEIRRNGSGAACKWWKHKMGTPEHISFRMASRDIWEKEYKPHLLKFEPERTNLGETRKDLEAARLSNVWAYFEHMFIWELGRRSLGDEVFYSSLLTDPEWIHDFNRTYTDFYKQYFRHIFDKVGVPDGVWIGEDLGYSVGLFASPKVLEDLFLPYYKEITDFFHSYDLPVVLHSCGSVAEALPLIVQSGFDALNPIERKANNNDPFVFAERYRDRLAFVGGFDVRLLATNDEQIIRREVAQYIEGMKARGARLIFASDHSIPPQVSYDSYRLALDVYRAHMWYP